MHGNTKRMCTAALLASAAVLLLAVAPVKSTETMNIAYFTAWGIYGRAYPPTKVDVSKVTHVLYAFANIKDGQCVLGDSYADIEKTFPGMTYKDPRDMSPGNHNGNIGWFATPGKYARAINPNLKFIISIGGWSWSGAFSEVARTQATREKFVNSCVQFMLDYNFDGIDVDWEFPVAGGLPGNVYDPSDRDTYTKLMVLFRSTLDKLQPAKHYDLSIASSQNPKYLRDNYDLNALMKPLDYVNIMTYDYNGCFFSKSGHQTPLYCNPQDPGFANGFCVEKSVDVFLNAGVPSCKLNVGVAFYGRAAGKVPAEGTKDTAADWLNKDWNTQSCPAGRYERGIDDYKDIVQLRNSGTYQEIWDDVAKAPLLVNKDTGDMWSYDNVQSVEEKVKYVKANNLGGVFFWSIDGDVDPSNDASLLSALWTGIKDYKSTCTAPEPGSPTPPPTHAPPTPPPSTTAAPTAGGGTQKPTPRPTMAVSPTSALPTPSPPTASSGGANPQCGSCNGCWWTAVGPAIGCYPWTKATCNAQGSAYVWCDGSSSGDTPTLPPSPPSPQPSLQPSPTPQPTPQPTPFPTASSSSGGGGTGNPDCAGCNGCWWTAVGPAIGCYPWTEAICNAQGSAYVWCA